MPFVGRVCALGACVDALTDWRALVLQWRQLDVSLTTAHCWLEVASRRCSTAADSLHPLTTMTSLSSLESRQLMLQRQPFVCLCLHHSSRSWPTGTRLMTLTVYCPVYLANWRTRKKWRIINLQISKRAGGTKSPSFCQQFFLVETNLGHAITHSWNTLSSIEYDDSINCHLALRRGSIFSKLLRCIR